MARRKLLFVYNADRGAWNKLFDAVHKIVSPSTYPCSLCALTYGKVSMHRQWADFLRALPHDVQFAYRDEWKREHGTVPPLPALLEVRDGASTTLLDKTAIDQCKSLDDLIARVREVVQ